MATPLSGIRVVAFEHSVAAPFCTRLLADWGADVIKVERPDGGDFARHWDATVQGWSSYFVWLNRGKRSLTLDIRHPRAQDVLTRLVRSADVVVQNLSPAAAARAGLDAGTIQEWNPRAVYCAISGYGSSGPYAERKAYDLLVQGEAGIMSLTGSRDAPARVGVSICDLGAGIFAATAILTALFDRERTGHAARLEVSMLDAMLEFVGGPLIAYMGSGRLPARPGMRHNLVVPYGPYEALDSVLVSFAVEHDDEWRRFCLGVLDDPALLNDPRYTHNPDRLTHRTSLEPLIEERFRTAPASTWEERLARSGIAYGRVNDLAAVAAHQQVEARGSWATAEIGGATARVPRDPVIYDGHTAGGGQVPEAGQHTREILSVLGLTREEITSLTASGVAGVPSADGLPRQGDPGTC